MSLQGVALDVRLALRLLVKHMGPTFVGVVAMAFAIWCGLIGFELYAQLLRPTMPLEGGDRIVGVVMSNAANAREDTPTLHDFTAWRPALTSIEHVGAFPVCALATVGPVRRALGVQPTEALRAE